MRTLACEPCAKRKVRCDRAEPSCSNCKRRKKDLCVYLDVSPTPRIKKLEAQIRNLGGDPDAIVNNDIRSETTAATPTEDFSSSSEKPWQQSRHRPGLLGLQHGGEGATPHEEDKTGDPVVLEEDGQPFYLESRPWNSWHVDGYNQQAGVSNHNAATRNPFLVRNNPTAFQAILSRTTSVDLSSRLPSTQDAHLLWNTFHFRIEPLIRITFRWVLKDFEIKTTQAGSAVSWTDPEYAFLFALYLLSVVSLSDDECQSALRRSKSDLLADYQMLCEEAVARTNLFCITDIVVLKALAMYIMAGAERLSTQSMWSVMGLVIRNAEKLGIHRDGTLLGLSLLETEDRRRLWWQLQHFDLGLAVMTGVTPLTLTAEWDAKLPLNIEDEDIHAHMTKPPAERKGLTSMAYCLYTYWVIDHQRKFLQAKNSRFELSWQTKKSLPDAVKGSLIEQLEEGLNKNFLQYCDPINPLHTLIQLSARALVCMLRLRTLYPPSTTEIVGQARREELLQASMRSLEYNIAMHSQQSVAHFQWWFKGMSPWHPLMCVLVEASQQDDLSRTQQIWDLLARLYSVNMSLSQLAEDRRRSHAAGLVVSAWKAHQLKFGNDRCPDTPVFVTKLEGLLRECQRPPTRDATSTVTQPVRVDQNENMVESAAYLTQQETDAMFELDFQDIDWDFWNSID